MAIAHIIIPKEVLIFFFFFQAADQKTKGKFIFFGGDTFYGSTKLSVMKMTFSLISG